MNEIAYYRWPTVHGDRVVFVSEDDLWEVSIDGGEARRLTSGLGEARNPVFSPDGSKIAYVGSEEGSPEVFVMDSRGGPGRQLTYFGTNVSVTGWTADGESVVFRTNHGQFSRRIQTLFEVDADGGLPRDQGLGPAFWTWRQPDGGGRILGRNADDLARWKRYRGGTAGQLWIDRGEGWERLLEELNSGLVRPIWIGGRIYFLCDETGYGNVWSCDVDGGDLRQHTDHRGFYARGLHSDGERLVYSVGGTELWVFEPASDTGRQIEVRKTSPRTQLNRKYVSAGEYLGDAMLHPKGHSLVVTARGKLFDFGNWEGAVRQLGEAQGVRYRLPLYTKDGDSIVVVSDEGGEERLEVYAADGSEEPRRIEHDDIGRATDIGLSPDGKRLAITNHRHELLVVDLETGETKSVDHGPGLGIRGFDWSPDSRWIAYVVSDTWQTSFLRVVDTSDWSLHDLTAPGYRDESPVFDPKGRYLYFVSSRWFEPVYDSLFDEISFPKSSRPCVVTLQADLDSLFLEKPRPLDGGDDDDEDEDESSEAEDSKETADKSEEGQENDGSDDDGKEDDKKKEEEKVPDVEIEFEGIEDRVEPFPAPVGLYYGLAATEDRVLWLRFENHPRGDDDDEGGVLRAFDLKKRKAATVAEGVDGFDLSLDRSTLLLGMEDGLRVVEASTDGVSDDDNPRPSRKTGWIDLSRVAVAVEPRAEWEQMLREAWRLMRDQYWDPSLNGIDWEDVWTRYRGDLDAVASRSEFSDLVWRMQGELGTSHAYEIGGDYRQPPRYAPGLLAADFSWDAEAGAYRIDRVVRGAPWNRGERSPLLAPGVNARAGEHVLAINGRRLTETTTPYEALVKHAGREVEVVLRGEDGQKRTKTVRALRSEFKARYRAWVQANRKHVHEASDGRLGYIHIPDMSAEGFAEFHRGFLPELRREGLVVDVRNNGGGNVSQLILEKLARRQLGYDVGRWTQPLPVPSESIPGPMVALTDENAGSDGDIFSHCFKLMKLGPLVGKRTWGGVVGIWPKHHLVDGSYTTQPEFAFWFHDVGFSVENYGTDPDVVVEDPPETNGQDVQLDRTIEIAMELLRANPVTLPDFGKSTTILRPPEG